MSMKRPAPVQHSFNLKKCNNIYKTINIYVCVFHWLYRKNNSTRACVRTVRASTRAYDGLLAECDVDLGYVAQSI